MTDRIATDQWVGPEARTAFQDNLRDAGHVVPTGMPGVVGRGEDFEAVVAGLSRALRARQPDGIRPLRVSFPPVVPQGVFEHTDYVSSFPQLIGSLRIFAGDNAQHAALLAARETGDDWTELLSSSHLMMVSAACHPIYGTLAGQTLTGDLRFDTVGSCFRHEPSPDPARLVSFRMHEQVFVGSPVGALAHRDEWLGRITDLLGTLGLTVRVDVANDPFFGRAGRMLAVGQREETLKFEILVDIFDDEPTAIASGNAHRDHFGENFEITLADGGVAHSSCFGLGLERTTLALLRRHGLKVASWPSGVRGLLEL